MTPVVIVVVAMSRPRLLRWCLSLIFFAVMTPLAVWRRAAPGSQLRGWRTGAGRQGWHDVNLCSADPDVYRSQW